MCVHACVCVRARARAFVYGWLASVYNPTTATTIWYRMQCDHHMVLHEAHKRKESLEKEEGKVVGFKEKKRKEVPPPDDGLPAFTTPAITTWGR
jgi:hypothetical protein